MGYKHYYMFQTIRPRKVFQAATFLAQNSELYQKEGVCLSNDWLLELRNNTNQEISEFLETAWNDYSEINELQSCTVDHFISETDAENNDEINNGSDEEWNEIEERPVGTFDTVLQPSDMCEQADHILSFAPGEGNQPLGLFTDKDSEYLAFPTIFCGKRRVDNEDKPVPVHYSTICKWELRNRDRRAAKSVPNTFYKLKKLQMKTIQDTAMISLRKCKTKGRTNTAKDFKTEDSVKNIIHLDEGYRVFKNLRGPPPYFERCKKDLFAMIRQLGYATWFCSFSAADTKWVHLLQILGRLIDNVEYSEDEVKQMSWEKKSELIQNDPVTCARNFDHMIQLFIHKVLKSAANPIGEITDFFYQVEFQQRGSPHVHALFWIKDAPKYPENPIDELTQFLDTHLSCEFQINSEMEELVNLQIHRHAKSCKKNNKNVCRFHFPVPPMRRTMIIEPLETENISKEELCEIKQISAAIKDELNNMNPPFFANFKI